MNKHILGKSEGAIKDAFKKTMSGIGTQAMILSSGTSRNDKQLHGMTLSSVSSLSIYPKPLLQFNLHLPSYTSLTLHKHKYMGIHIMPPTAKSVYLGRTFASGVKQANDLLKMSEGELLDGEVFHEMTTPFHKISPDDWLYHDIEDHNVSIPILKESEQVLICKTQKNITIDDHEIWIAQVLDILRPNPSIKNEASGGLLYFNRGFHRIGENLHE